MDIKNLKEVMEIFEKSQLSELKIKDKDGMEIVLKKDDFFKEPKAYQAPAVRPMPAAEPMSPSKEKGSEDIDPKKGIKCPMVGTLYHSPEPGAKEFVKVGDSVKKGDVVCVVEAMKVFNEIKADKDGIIKEKLVENGEPVEFGQFLLILE